jgi:purine-nucleoside phosphorylase
MIITDHINLLGTNPLIGPNDERFGVRFPDQSNVWDQALREILKKCYTELNITIREGVYVCSSGPTFETPAEVRMFALLGGDALGMSTVPEAIVANHMGIKVVGVSCITNLACGISPNPLSY